MRKVESEGNPSELSDSYWLFARAPKWLLGILEKNCLEWLVNNADEYASSGRIYPRDISEEELATPTSEPELSLRKIDLEAIEATTAHLGSSSCSRSEIDNLMIFTALTGKWLIYERRNSIDEVWNLLSSEIKTGRLPYEAKVSTIKDNKLSDDKSLHVVCIYTHNFLFREDVRTCRALLLEMGFKGRLYYKPDIMTSKGMYRLTGSKINHRYFG